MPGPASPGGTRPAFRGCRWLTQGEIAKGRRLMKKRRTYIPGGSVSDMTQLLANDETRREPRLARRLFVAGMVLAVTALAVATMRLLGG